MPVLPEFLDQHTHDLHGRHSTYPWGFVTVEGSLVATVIRIGVLAALLIAFAALVLPASAQEGTAPIVTDDQVNAIAQKLYCPVCENITLDTCGTAACEDWRYEIRLQLEAGMSEQQIIEDFVHRFGDRVVGTPLDPLLRTVSLLTPWLVIAVALGAVVLVLVRRKGGVISPPVTTEGTPTGRYQDLFEQDLRGS